MCLKVKSVCSTRTHPHCCGGGGISPQTSALEARFCVQLRLKRGATTLSSQNPSLGKLLVYLSLKVGVVKVMPHRRVQQHTVEQIVDAPVPELAEEIVDEIHELITEWREEKLKDVTEGAMMKDAGVGSASVTVLKRLTDSPVGVVSPATCVHCHQNRRVSSRDPCSSYAGR